MSAPPLRPLGFGEVLDGSFSLYRRHFSTLFLTALIPFIPVSLASGMMSRQIMLLDPVDTDFGAGMFAWFVPAMLLSMVGFALMWAALTREASRAIQGEEVSLTDGYARGARAFLPLVGAGILATIVGFAVIFGVSILALIVGGIVGLAAGSAAATVVGTVIGIGVVLLFFAAWLVAAAALFAVVPAVVVEGCGPWEALKRSWQLSRGAWLRIISVFIVGYLIVTLPTFGVMLAAGMGAAMWDPAAAATLSNGQIFVQQLVGTLSGALTFPFFVGCLVLLYYDRRVRTEALDLEIAAAELAHAP